MKQLFDVSHKLIANQEEICGMSLIHRESSPWQRTTLLSDRVVRLSTAKVYVFSDSVLCLGEIHACPDFIDAWKEKIQWFTNTLQYRELDRSFQLLQEIQKTMKEINIESEQFKDRITFMPMYNDILWESEENNSLCFANPESALKYAKRFTQCLLNPCNVVAQ